MTCSKIIDYISSIFNDFVSDFSITIMLKLDRIFPLLYFLYHSSLIIKTHGSWNFLTKLLVTLINI